MNYDFLKRLFASCSDEDDRYMDGLNLSELYEQVEETATAACSFSEAMDKADLSHAVVDAVHSAAYGLATAHELQGFINDFRLCAQMRRELTRMGVRP